jgi:hypothetical protein
VIKGEPGFAALPQLVKRDVLFGTSLSDAGERLDLPETLRGGTRILRVIHEPVARVTFAK